MRPIVITAAIAAGGLATVLFLWLEPELEPQHLRDHDSSGLAHPFAPGGALEDPRRN